MPTYEYVCRSCDEHLEVVQSFTDEPLIECPSCEGELKKVFGNIGIVFKGSGFYKTDSRSKSSKSGSDVKSGGEAKSSGPASDSKPDTSQKSSESKPADKPATTATSDKPSKSTVAAAAS